MILAAATAVATAGSAVGHGWVTTLFILAQFAVAAVVCWDTWLPLLQSAGRMVSIRERIASVRESLDATFFHSRENLAAAENAVADDPHVHRAWRLSVAAQHGARSASDAIEPEVAFEPARLLPLEYNARLDSAAPGLFTAIGIVGTFTGLIIGFMGVNPAQATESIGGLIGGMQVAFVNSLVGVGLSIVWSYLARRFRHSFDRSAHLLQAEAEEWFERRGVGDELRSGFSQVVTALQEQNAQLRTEILRIQQTSSEASGRVARHLLKGLVLSHRGVDPLLRSC